ncbi:HIT domain-containing protein [Candidatus Pacearchaeota archaeon]|nr:HIT domain-containing protein [Candidatus Pacearchaeota archaeon]
MSDCIFCKIARKELKSNMVAETGNFIAILDAHPVAPGHTLVIPKKHLVTLLDIPNSLGEEMLSLCKNLASGFLDNKTGDAFNIAMNNLPPAGQVVPHAHIHLIPRKDGDSIKRVV